MSTHRSPVTGVGDVGCEVETVIRRPAFVEPPIFAKSSGSTPFKLPDNVKLANEGESVHAVVAPDAQPNTLPAEGVEDPIPSFVSTS
jgi:hypothetical protein